MRMNRYFHSSLLLTILTLMGIGLVQVYSSSYIFAIETYGDGLFFFKKQLVYSFIGLMALIAGMTTPRSWLEKHGWILFAFATLLVALTLIPGLGVKVGGAARWLKLPLGIRFEPSELLKYSFPFFFATMLTRQQEASIKIPLWMMVTLLALPAVILLRQPDFGSFAILIIVSVLLLVAFGLPWKYVAGSLVLILPSFYYLVMMKDYRRARLLSFLDPWADPDQKGFQAIQSMLSFHSGGIWGVGLGQGQGKLFFLPEAHTDFTLAVLGEETGFLGFLFILFLYGMVVLRGFQIALKQESAFLKATILGISTTFAVHVFINCGVVMGLLPTKGLTLPFLSFGGSHLVTLCFFFGFLIQLEQSENAAH